MKIIVLLLSSVLLFGCAKPKPQVVYTTIEVEKAVYQIPKFNIPPKPELPVDLLTDKDYGKHNTIGKAYVSSIDILKSSRDKLYNLLEAIKKGEE